MRLRIVGTQLEHLDEVIRFLVSLNVRFDASVEDGQGVLLTQPLDPEYCGYLVGLLDRHYSKNKLSSIKFAVVHA